MVIYNTECTKLSSVVKWNFILRFDSGTQTQSIKVVYVLNMDTSPLPGLHQTFVKSRCSPYRTLLL